MEGFYEPSLGVKYIICSYAPNYDLVTPSQLRET